MNLLFTICGRCGSKQVKGKNVRPFLGIPIYLYTYAAIELFGEDHGRTLGSPTVGVSSDDPVLLAGLSRLPRTVPVLRPHELADDAAPKFAAIDHCFRAVQAQGFPPFDYVLDLDITSPLRRVEDILATIALSERDRSLDCVFTGVPARRNPYFNMVKVEHARATKALPSSFTARQQAPAMFDMNASVYCYRVASWNVFRTSPLDGTCGLTQMIDTGILDIDSEHDFEFLEVIAAHLFAHRPDFARVHDRARALFRRADP